MTELAKEYGTALFLLASEEQSVEACAASLVTVEEAFQSNPDYVALLSAPSIPKQERLALLDEAFKDIAPSALSFVKLLCEKGRLSFFSECKEEFDALLAASQRVVTAKVTSAVPLTDAQKQALIDKLQAMDGRTVTADYHLDASLLGGVVVELDDRVLDGSLKQQIRKLKEVIDS